MGSELKLLGKAQDSLFWKEVREDEVYRDFREALLNLWDSDGFCEIPQLRYTDFRRFTYDGDRDSYEKPFFQRRRIMSTAAILSLIYPEREDYMIKLMDVIFAICDEYTWCLPAHQTELGKNNNRHIDLFAAETGFSLAEIYTLLGDRMEPLITDRIRVEIDRRIVESYTETEFFWEKVNMNWASVCAGSVGCTLMLMRPDIFDEYEKRICKTMDCFLSGYGPDGICEEGFSYWMYGFGFFTVWADMVRTYTSGRIDYFKQDKVRLIAPFLSRMYLTGPVTVSFADSGRTGKYSLGILHYLKSEYPDDVILPDPKYCELMDNCVRWCYFLRTFTWMDRRYITKEYMTEPLEYYAQSVNWLIVRKPGYSFAAKGGHNAEHHNHNDVGSFILAKDGKALLTDPGAGVYTRQYFSNERYTQISCGSHGHSVPYFGTEEDREEKGFFYGYQKTGRNCCADNCDYSGNTFSMDIGKAYMMPEVRHVYRTFTICDDGFSLNDSFDTDASLTITERFVFLSPPRICDGIAECDSLSVIYDKDKYDVSIKEGNFRPDCLVYFLDLRLKRGIFESTLRFVVRD